MKCCFPEIGGSIPNIECVPKLKMIKFPAVRLETYLPKQTREDEPN